ncbi:MAG: hypothetical protein ACFFDI_06550 [Promethearchaeota archaeon]
MSEPTEEKWTVREEVTEVLRRRTTVEGQFNWIRSYYKDEISEKIKQFQVNEKTIVAAYYLARHIMDQVGTHLHIVDEATFQQELITDDVRVNLIVKTLMESSQYYPGKSIDERVAYYSVLSEVTKKIYRSYVQQKKRFISPKVILVNLVDSFFNPIFHFFKEEVPDTDFRWVMAEIEAFLRNDFPQKYYEKITHGQIFPKTFDEDLFFEAGAYIVSKYLDWTETIEKVGVIAAEEEEAAEKEVMIAETELEAIEAEITAAEAEVKAAEAEVIKAGEIIKGAEAEIKAVEEELQAAKVGIRAKELIETKKIQAAEAEVTVAKKDLSEADRLSEIAESAKLRAKNAELVTARATAKVKVAAAEKLKAEVEIKKAEAELKSAEAEKLKADLEVKKAEAEVKLKRMAEAKKQKRAEAEVAKFKAAEAARLKDYVPLGVGGKHEYVYAVSAFYNLPQRKLVAQPLPTDDESTSDDLIRSAKQLALVNQQNINKSSYYLKYAKFQALIGSGYDKKVRNYFALNHERNDIGLWQKFIISTEDVNLSSVLVYLQERCQNIKGSLKIYAATHSKPDDIPLLPITQYWDEAMINSTEERTIEEYIFAKDKYREMKYVPIVFLRMTENQGDILLRKEWGREGQVEERKTFLSIEEVDYLLNVADILGKLLFSEAGLVYSNRGKKVSLTIFPLELVFIHKEDPDEVLYATFQYEEGQLAGQLAANQKERDRRTGYVKRMLQSKVQQILSGLRVKALMETVIAKMGDDSLSTQDVEPVKLDPVWLFYSASVDDLKESPEKAKIDVDQVYEEALEKQEGEEFLTPEQLEEETFKQNFVEAVLTTNLIKLVTFKLNEILLETIEDTGLLSGERLDAVKQKFQHQKTNFLVEYSSEVPEFIHKDVDTMLNEINSPLQQAAEFFAKELVNIRSSVKKLSKEELEYILLGHTWR